MKELARRVARWGRGKWRARHLKRGGDQVVVHPERRYGLEARRDWARPVD